MSCFLVLSIGVCVRSGGGGGESRDGDGGIGVKDGDETYSLHECMMDEKAAQRSSVTGSHFISAATPLLLLASELRESVRGA